MVKCHELAALKPDSGGYDKAVIRRASFRLLLVVCLAFPWRPFCRENTAIGEILCYAALAGAAGRFSHRPHAGGPAIAFSAGLGVLRRSEM